jgi:2'-5' RNA ligase
LWAGVTESAALDRLHDRIEARLRRLGVAPDRRKFAPHVTLARLGQAPLVKVRDYLALNGGFASDDFPVSEFQLYSSHLGAAGAIHRVEASYPLDGAL